MDTKYYSLTELARALGVSRQAIFDRIKRGTLNAERIGNQIVISSREFKRAQVKRRRGS